MVEIWKIQMEWEQIKTRDQKKFYIFTAEKRFEQNK